MDSPEHPSGQKERELFIQAMEKATPAERAAFLDAACENDTALRRRPSSCCWHASTRWTHSSRSRSCLFRTRIRTH
jgi:hypothetical protein